MTGHGEKFVRFFLTESSFYSFFFLQNASNYYMTVRFANQQKNNTQISKHAARIEL